MRKLRSWFSFFLACAIGLCFVADVQAVPVDAPPEPPSVSAESAILINADDGSVYFEKNADEQMGPASTTKLMTALVALELCDPDTTVTIPPEAVGIEGSSIYLVVGERLTVRELLYALLLSSANDAATALAITTSGSVENFCKKMNEKAEQLGLSHTRFENPHGLYHDTHYTTARELATIAQEVLRVPLLRQIVATYKYTIPHDGIDGRRLLVNHNKLLRSYDGALGMKTGFTKKTGRTLVSAAEREGLTLIAVTLNAPDDWKDHTAMLDYGFASYECVTIAPVGEFEYSMPICGGARKSVKLRNTEPLTLTLPKDHESPRCVIESNTRFAIGAVRQGQSLATVTVTCHGRSVSSPLVATASVPSAIKERTNPIRRLLNFFKLDA